MDDQSSRTSRVDPKACTRISIVQSLTRQVASNSLSQNFESSLLEKWHRSIKFEHCSNLLLRYLAMGRGATESTRMADTKGPKSKNKKCAFARHRTCNAQTSVSAYYQLRHPVTRSWPVSPCSHNTNTAKSGGWGLAKAPCHTCYVGGLMSQGGGRTSVLVHAWKEMCCLLLPNARCLVVLRVTRRKRRCQDIKMRKRAKTHRAGSSQEQIWVLLHTRFRFQVLRRSHDIWSMLHALA